MVKKLKMTTLKSAGLLLIMTALLVTFAGCRSQEGGEVTVQEVPAQQAYSYINPDETKAQTDEGMVIDGVLDEPAYQDNSWLYLSNNEGGNDVSIAMTSHYGEKGMYLVFDVTETVPIYVNLDRPSYMNSSMELYLSDPHVTSMKENDVFEIDLMPTGDMLFKRSNGRDGYTNVATTDDIMACLGATTKGGPVNTKECYGYCLELFIPWDYLQWLKMDVEAIKNGYVHINPAHITSYNSIGTDTEVDRYWYHYVQQNGVSFSNVSRHFRFNGQGVMGAVPVIFQQGEHYTITGAKTVIPGMNATVHIIPEEGYAISSVLIDGKEQLQNVDFNQDGSITLKLSGTNESITVGAQAEAITQGNKTLSGKVILSNIDWDSFDGLALTYIGPKGEKPLEIDSNGNFVLEELEQGFYIIKAEKKGYQPVSRSICLNRDVYTELVLKYDYFQVLRGNCWILDEQNQGVLYKKTGEGQVLSNSAYYDFTLRANLKYDLNLAQLGTSDDYTQQRTGLLVRFSNGKTWHIHLLQEKGQYILQYAKISGDDSVTGWQTIHTLNDSQASRYTGGQGIRLSVMRQGNYAAIWLDDQLIRIEVLEEQYDSCSAQLGIESWASNYELLEIPFSIAGHSTVNVKGSPFMDHAETWNISGQYEGKVHKQGEKGVYAWLESAVVTNDVTTVARDLSPDTLDYSLAYIFQFSNGEQLRVRLHHTDSDGAYRIQTMNGSTVTPAWKVGYTLTDEEAEKVKAGGIEYRVKLSGTTAYVYLDGQEVCTYDLSTVAATGLASDVDKCTATVSFALDGNYGYTTELPFKLVDISKEVKIILSDMAGGSVTADKESCKLGEKVTLTVSGKPGYYYSELLINGKPIDPSWDGTYQIKTEENIYFITGEFTPGKFQAEENSHWNLLKQNQELLLLTERASGSSGWLTAQADGDDITATVQDKTPKAKDFSMCYQFDFSNGKTLGLRLCNDGGAYKLQAGENGASGQWQDLYTLKQAEAARLTDDGIKFRAVIENQAAVVYLDGAKVCAVDLSAVLPEAEDGASPVTCRIKLAMEGNLKQTMQIPFKLIDSRKRIRINIEAMEGGKVTADGDNYQLGDTVILTVSPDAGYSQKVSINGQPLLLDWKTNTYSFEATEAIYNITGSFQPSVQMTARDENRWDTANQAHGVVSAYYPNHDDAWILEMTGEYRLICVNAKNYMTGEDGNGIEGFAVNLGFKLDNGKEYIFRIIKEKGKYYAQRFGIGGSDWKKTELEPAAVAAICNEGVEFKLERTAGNTLTVSVNGVVYDHYTVEGVDASTKVTAVLMGHYGNKGKQIQLPYQLRKPADAPQVQLNIPQLTGGTVTPEQETYLVGDTVTLRITPEEGYSQRLYLDGEPLLLDWKASTYSFVATKEAYTLTGSFQPSLNAVAKDAGRWDTNNQAHGIFNIYYPTKEDAWILEIQEEYRAISVKAKNYLAGDDGSGGEGFAVNLGFRLDNGNEYIFRVIRENGAYYAQRFGIGGSDWKKVALDQAAVAAICGEGVDFRLDRISESALCISVNGVVCDTFEMEGVTEENKVTAVIIGHYGNKGQKISLPFVLRTPEQTADVQISIGEMTGGTVTSQLSGDVVTLTVTPAPGSSLESLTVLKDGQPVDLGQLHEAGGQYSFIAQDGSYTVEAEFTQSLFTVVNGSWDLSNQNEGYLTIVEQKDGTTVITSASDYTGISLTVKDHTPSKNTDGSLKKGNFSAQLSFLFDDGKAYQVRLHNTDADGNYKLQNMGGGNSLTGWKWQADLTAEQKEKLLDGDGVTFAVKLIGADAQLWVDGSLMKTVSLGEAYAGKTAQVQFCMNGNTGVENIKLPFTLTAPGAEPEEPETTEPTEDPDAPAVQLNIGEMTGGTVTAGQLSYQAGDTVTLVIAPDQGNALKSLTVEKDGQTVALSSDYSFVAEGGVYTVAAEFAPSMFQVVSGSWDLSRQYEGNLIITQQGDGTTVLTNEDGYNEVSVTVKDFTPSKNTDGSLKQGNFSMQISFIFDDGKAYQVRLHNTDADGNYKLQNMGGGNSLTGWKWQADLTATQKEKLLEGDGVTFAVKLAGANAELWVDGTLMKTVELGTAYEGKTAQIKLCMNGNRDVTDMVIPFTLGKPQAEPIFSIVSGQWDLSREQDGIITILDKVSDGTTVLTNAADYQQVAVTVKDFTPSKNTDGSLKQGNFSMQISFIFDDGKAYQVRLHNTDADGNYKLQNMGGTNSLTGWKWQADLTATQKEKLLEGDGVEFAVKLVGTNAQLWVDGTFMKSVELGTAYDGKLAQIKLCMNGNKGVERIEIPFQLKREN